MKEIAKTEILSRVSLFQNISDKSREALADICYQKNLRKKEQLFIEGEMGVYLYILVTGGIQLYKTSPDGKDVVIKVVKPGEMFAEVILFESDTFPVSAVALKTSTVYQIPRLKFNSLLSDEEFRNDFMRNLMVKLRFLTAQIQYLTVHDVEERLKLFLEQQFGRKSSITPGMSKKDIAAAIGATPETFSRLLLRLKQEEKLNWDGATITVSDAFWKTDKIERE